MTGVIKIPKDEFIVLKTYNNEAMTVNKVFEVNLLPFRDIVFQYAYSPSGYDYEAIFLNWQRHSWFAFPTVIGKEAYSAGNISRSTGYLTILQVGTNHTYLREIWGR